MNAKGDGGAAPPNLATLGELLPRLSDGSLSALALLQDCLAAIAAHDRAGAGLSAILRLNPQAQADAAALDAAWRRSGVQGPLHGVGGGPEGQYRHGRPADDLGQRGHGRGDAAPGRRADPAAARRRRGDRGQDQPVRIFLPNSLAQLAWGRRAQPVQPRGHRGRVQRGGRRRPLRQASPSRASAATRGAPSARPPPTTAWSACAPARACSTVGAWPRSRPPPTPSRRWRAASPTSRG